MSDNQNKNGGFQVNIDERNLAAERYESQERRREQTSRSEPARTGYYSAVGDSKEERRAHRKRNRVKARKNKRIFAIVWLCMVLLVAFTIASYLIGGAQDFFAVGRNEGTTEIVLPDTVDSEELSQILYQRGAISKPEFFKLYADVTVDEDEWEWFQKGVYEIGTNLDYEDIINRLQGGNESREEVRVTFPEGSNALEIGALLEENEVCTQEEFLAALNDIDFTNYDVIAALGSTAGKYYNVEGYLFPDTYDFWKGEELESVIGKMLNNFQSRISDTTMALVRQSGYSLDEIVTMASIIQGEAADDSDMYLVSAVIHNRLQNGIYGLYYLQCDSTIYYPYKNFAAVPESGSLDFGSYNTYVIEGLPDGAICNPGMDAIMAALNPSKEGDAPYYLYFCHAADGTAYYATNEEDHNYNRWLAGLSD